MNIDSIPVIDVPYFLTNDSNDLTITLSAVAGILIVLFLLFYRRLKNTYQIYRLLKNYRQDTLSQREAAYQLTAIISDLLVSTRPLYNNNELEIISDIKYRKDHNHSKGKLLSILSKSLYIALFGKH